ncbi:hypothetical protein [Ralstonia sp. 24A2]|uniref:hypothetical protein n=1 Tax=Ralstonia sp. 24A2 TaxID=3447364 RepID=UPI003F6A3C5F
MNSRLSSLFSRRAALALVATLSASATLLSAQPAAASEQPNFDAPAATQAGRFDPYTQGADRQADTYGYLSRAGDRFDPYSQGADRQADTYGYLSRAGDRFDPYSQGADRQADTYGYLSWNGDTRYPNGSTASRA